jgi:hypothetical protein
MSDPSHPTPKALPRWIVAVVSVGVFLHLSALAIHVLAARSGPWGTPFGITTVEPPIFVSPFAKVVRPIYIAPLRFDNDYHFQTDRPEVVDVAFMIRIKDKYGAVTTRWFPDPDANFAVRFRQSLLAQGLGDDVQIQDQKKTERIAAAEHKAPVLKFWDLPPEAKAPKDPDDKRPKNMEMKLVTIDEHLAPKGAPLFKPREWSEVLARSYTRYLLRTTEGAQSAELVRVAKNTVLPDNLFLPQPLEGTFDQSVSNFGEVKR